MLEDLGHPDARDFFVGDYGLDVLTGQVLDPGGRRVGVFRAFRVEE